MKVAMLLADYAEVVNGKLYVMGGGWSVTGPAPVPTALAIKIEVPWEAVNQKHNLKLELFDADKNPVKVPISETEKAPLSMVAGFEIGKARGILPGSPLDVPFAVNIPPVDLEPGKRYFWRLTIDGATREDWQVVFSTRLHTEKAPAVP